MPRLNMKQVGGYAAGAGFKGKGLSIAIAVAFAESGGNTQATGPVGEKGLWQVYPRAHPDWDRGGNLYDPGYNARAAYAISNGGNNWHPWTTYNIGSYLLYLPQAEVAAQNVQPVKGLQGALAGLVAPDTGIQSGIGNAVGGAIDTAKAVGNVGKAVTWLAVPQHWVRIAEVVAGSILVILAISVILRPVVEPVAKTAVKVGAAVA